MSTLKFLRTKRRKVIATIAFIVLLLVLIIWFLMRFMNSEAVGVVTPVKTNDQAAEPTVTYIEHQGEYISFSYPSTYQLRERQPDKTLALEQHVLGTVNTLKSRQIAVTVNRFTTLDEESAYKLRTTMPQTYEEDRTDINGQPVITFRNKTIPEVALFIPYRNKIAIIVISSSHVSPKELEADLLAFAASLTWL